PEAFTHPDPWMDSEPGALTFPGEWWDRRSTMIPKDDTKYSTTDVEAIHGELEGKLPITVPKNPGQDEQVGNLDDYWQPGKTDVPGWRWPIWDVQDPVQLPTKPRTLTGGIVEDVQELNGHSHLDHHEHEMEIWVYAPKSIVEDLEDDAHH